MAGNTRGKLKEQFEGIHRNFTWIAEHCGKSLLLVQEHNPKLSESIKSLATGTKILDDLAMDIYSKL